MMTQLDRALAEVYLEEAHRQRHRLTHGQIQAQAGIPGRTWRNYFGSRNTPPRNAMPSTVQFQIAAVLGVPASELMRRAEERALMEVDPEARAEDALRQLPADAQAEIAKVAADLRPKRDAAQTGRAANGGPGH